jgi:hypothetical protein
MQLPCTAGSPLVRMVKTQIGREAGSCRVGKFKGVVTSYKRFVISNIDKIERLEAIFAVSEVKVYGALTTTKETRTRS